jgi:hypothetical protein
MIATLREHGGAELISDRDGVWQFPPKLELNTVVQVVVVNHVPIRAKVDGGVLVAGVRDAAAIGRPLCCLLPM